MIGIEKLNRIFERMPRLMENDFPVHVPIPGMPNLPAYRITWKDLAEIANTWNEKHQ